MPLISWMYSPTPSQVDSMTSWLKPAVAIIAPTNAPSRWPTPPTSDKPAYVIDVKFVNDW